VSGVNGERDACDVAIIGGGPTGATLATFLKKHNPDLRVVIVEKERFPRDHVGESQLPGVSAVLHEMGCWDKVEAAGFPIKIGASYTWGRDQGRWNFDFYPAERFVDEPRPASYTGQRRRTAFQVDRAIYDEILLRHAQETGAEAREEVRVDEVLRDGDRVLGLRLSTGATLEAKHYVDASGAVGVLRRAMGVTSWEPEELRNIAVWEYWRNAEWAERIGVGATRVQVRSLPYGWVWFIPLGEDRTSVGLICPATHYKSTGLTPEALYQKAITEQEEIAGLMKNATPEGRLQSCKDWSHLADRLVGENWFVCGEAAGFADPILAAGLTMAQFAAKDLACTILELERGEMDAQWLRERYDTRNRKIIGQHIRFAQFWYAANGVFTDLKEHCQSIADEAGLSLSPEEAWRWLSQGGFTEEVPGQAVLGLFDLKSARTVIDRFAQNDNPGGYSIDRFNIFQLKLDGAREDVFGFAKDGRINRVDCFVHEDGRTLPLAGPCAMVVSALREASDLASVMQSIQRRIFNAGVAPENRNRTLHHCMLALEALISQGWVEASLDASGPRLQRKADWNAIRDADESEAAMRARDNVG